jgi:hypothetical protein
MIFTIMVGLEKGKDKVVLKLQKTSTLLHCQKWKRSNVVSTKVLKISHTITK